MKKLNFAVILVLLVLFTNQEKVKESDAWYPYNIPFDDGVNNFIHAGNLELTAPAGKDGFTKVENGHFYQGKKRIKFWGINFTGEINFPTHDLAEKLAKRVAKSGFNIVRLHHMDSNYIPAGIFDKTDNNTLKLSDEQLERLDYLIYQLKLNGVFVDINLHVGRRFTEGDGVVDAKKLPRNSKLATMFDKKLIELQKDYAQKLLDHFNPYTKKKYSDEPSVALVEITNENTLFAGWTNSGLFGLNNYKNSNENLSSYYIKELNELWNVWLLAKYKSSFELKNKWNIGVTPGGINLFKNADFISGLEYWVKEIHKNISAEIFIDEKDIFNNKKTICINVKKDYPASTVQLKQLDIPLEKDKLYELSFYAKSESIGKLELSVNMEKSPWTNYGLSEKIVLTGKWEKYRVVFKAKETILSNNRVSFMLGECQGKTWISNIRFAEAGATGLLENESLESKNIGRTEWKDRFLCSENRFSDNVEFYAALETSYFKEIKEYLVKTLKVKVPISTSNHYSDFSLPSSLSMNEGDYIDAHCYWDHPAFPNKRFDNTDFKQHNFSLVSNLDSRGRKSNFSLLSPIVKFAFVSEKNKPFVISEWNHVFPNDYEYEEPMILASYASLQDWDGLFLYTFSHKLNNLTKESITGWFDTAPDTSKMAQMPACAISFLRGDFKNSDREILIDYSRNDVLAKYRDYKGTINFNIEDFPLNAAYSYKIRKNSMNAEKTSTLNTLFTEKEIEVFKNLKIIPSSTSEISINTMDINNEYVAFHSPKAQGAAGFIKDKEICLGDLTIMLSKDCSVMLTSLDNKELSLSRKMLLTIVGKQKNTGMIKNEQNGLADWGKAPIILERIKGLILINNFEKLNVYALDGRGNRMKMIDREPKSYIKFQVGDIDTLWYEISGN